MDNSIIKGKNNNHKSRLSIRNSKNHKNTLSNPYNIIDVIDYNKSCACHPVETCDNIAQTFQL